MKRQLLITCKNEDKIAMQLKQAQGKSKVNLIGFTNLASLVSYAEKELEYLGIPKYKRTGAQFYYHASGPCAKAYKYSQGVTWVCLIRRSAGWHLVSVKRSTAYPQQKALRRLTLLESQDEFAIAVLRKNYSITKATDVELGSR